MKTSTINRTALGASLLLLALGSTACSKKKDGEGAGKATDTKGTASTGTGDATGKAVPSGGGIVQLDGSSTVFPLSQAVGEEYQRAGKGDVTVGRSGTGGGFKIFCRGEIDITGASRPIKKEEIEACKSGGIEYIELAVAYDGLAVVVNKANTWVDHLTVDELKKMWAPEAAETIKNWSQIRDGWPDKPLALFGPGTDSGTYDYFTQAIVGKEHSSRGDYTASEDDNVLVTGVAGAEGGLAFFGLAYYTENADRLKLVPIEDGKDDNGKGPILPSPETVNDGTYQPLARPIFIYVSVKSLSKGSVQNFVQYYLDNAKTLAPDVGYVGLPDTLYEALKKRFTERKTGSVFAGGSQTGMTVEKLFTAEGT